MVPGGSCDSPSILAHPGEPSSIAFLPASWVSLSELLGVVLILLGQVARKRWWLDLVQPSVEEGLQVFSARILSSLDKVAG